ncbi:tagaturonate reductase [Paenibacillus turpanensis]|uniref:tagaturonate reductase n=1 Tax=Paenibacillus turpanensis TaxID=2689078 RepID=UPI00140D79E3|nr:tagaturonate reductase [Paenibacillus turpanensis]
MNTNVNVCEAFPGPNTELPVKMLQFGEGNFLRGFVDWMVNRMNEQGLFNGSIAVVQPIEQGMVNVLNEQNGQYTLMMRGLRAGAVTEEIEKIRSIRVGVNPYTDYDAYIALAKEPQLSVVVSNTTESGIVYREEDRLEDRPQHTFPGKLTAFLYRRYQAFHGDMSKGLLILPCELIDRNGEKLLDAVLRHAAAWGLEAEFIDWLKRANRFCCTLVDRIVTGYPKAEVDELAARLGYEDKLLNTSELFHLWVIEGAGPLKALFPADEAGLQVVWTEDMTPFRSRKVRILNGAHTMTALAAYLAGVDTVRECVEDESISLYMNKGIFDEIIPASGMPEEAMHEYAEEVLERFGNPFIRHELLSISLNSVSKFKARVLPSIEDYVRRFGKLPRVLTFSLAALIAFYRGTQANGRYQGLRNGEVYAIQDDAAILAWFAEAWAKFDGTAQSAQVLAARVLQNEAFWGENLTRIEGLEEAIARHLLFINEQGMQKALRAAARREQHGENRPDHETE